MRNKFPGLPGTAFVYRSEMMGGTPVVRFRPHPGATAMKHIPFAALPTAERQAVVDALLRTGVPLRQVCVSRSDPALPGDEDTPFVTVSAGGWFRSYQASTGWTAQLERDLIALLPQDAQSGLQEQGDHA
jgi:hypothetical protein